MGKKGSWFSAIKRVFFTHNSKDKPTNGSNKKSSKEKKKGKGIPRQGRENKSIIPLFRKPSSIEKILGEADQLLIRPTSSSSQRAETLPANLPVRDETPPANLPVRSETPPADSPPPPPPPLKASSKAIAPKVTESRKENRYVPRLEPTSRNQHLSAVKIQAAFRGYLARRSSRALRGLVRLQEVVRGQNVKRQTMNAIKQMQLLVRVQTQIRLRRIQMLENQHQLHRNDNKSNLSKWTNQLSEAGQNEDWDDSLLTKEEEEERLRKKVEAVIKRERAMAYAYSHRLWKANPKPDHNPLDVRSNGFPWWWNWLERQVPEVPGTSRTKSIMSLTTPPRPNSEYNKPSPRLLNGNKNTNFDSRDSPTALSSRSTVRSQKLWTPTRTPPRPNAASSMHGNNVKYSKHKSSAFDADSLVSCPPFSVPNYMSPTVSAKSKARANSNPKERFPRTPGSDSNNNNNNSRRFSFPLTPNIAPFKWNKGGSNEDSASQIGMEKHESSRSIGEFSMDSAVSMPALVGRKPFNRFV